MAPAWTFLAAAGGIAALASALLILLTSTLLRRGPGPRDRVPLPGPASRHARAAPRGSSGERAPSSPQGTSEGARDARAFRFDDVDALALALSEVAPGRVKWHRRGGHARQRIDLDVTPWEESESSIDCAYLSGFLQEGLAGVLGVPVRVVHGPSCANQGGGHCTFAAVPAG